MDESGTTGVWLVMISLGIIGIVFQLVNLT